MMVFFLSNMLENQLMSTGAFEITLNGKSASVPVCFLLTEANIFLQSQLTDILPKKRDCSYNTFKNYVVISHHSCNDFGSLSGIISLCTIWHECSALVMEQLSVNYRPHTFPFCRCASVVKTRIRPPALHAAACANPGQRDEDERSHEHKATPLLTQLSHPGWSWKPLHVSSWVFIAFSKVKIYFLKFSNLFFSPHKFNYFFFALF